MQGKTGRSDRFGNGHQFSSISIPDTAGGYFLQNIGNSGNDVGTVFYLFGQREKANGNRLQLKTVLRTTAYRHKSDRKIGKKQISPSLRERVVRNYFVDNPIS